MRTAFKSLELGLSLLQQDNILRNIKAVKRYVASELDPSTNYESSWDFIRAAMHHDLVGVSHSKTEPEIIWYDKDQEKFSYALRNLAGDVDISEISSFSNEYRKIHEESYYNALRRFEEYFPETFVAFKELIAFIIFAKRSGYGGGTVSNRIGLIWLAPENYWSEDDWLENLVHEFIHNVLFLEDMVHTVFTAGGDRLSEEDALAISAIRQVKRGYDKSYHSAFVSFGIIEHYLQLGKKEKALTFLDPLTICVDDLVKNTNFITEHGKQLLFELAKQIVKTREFLKGKV